MKGNPPMKKQSWKRTDKGCIEEEEKSNSPKYGKSFLFFL